MSLPTIDSVWNHADPAASETAFRDLVPQAESANKQEFVVELYTQIARAQGLQRRFDDANASLRTAESLLTPSMSTAKARLLLERGRVLKTSGDKEGARPLFEQALEVAESAGLDYFTIDASHMIACVLPKSQGLAWFQRTFDLAEATQDPHARLWRGAAHHNLAWCLSHHGRHEEALALFEEGYLIETHENKRPLRASIATWGKGKQLRLLGRVEEALQVQMELLKHPERQNNTFEGYTRGEVAECLLALGRGDEAESHFALAWQLLKEDPWMVENSDRLDRMKKLGKIAS